MALIIKIAWRNIFRHRGKSLVIGVILFLGAFLMTIGNGVISGMDTGLQQTVVNSFTGDIVLISDKQESDNVFLEMMGKAVEPIHNYKDIKKVLSRQPMIRRMLPAGKNMAMVLNEDGGMPGFGFLLGVDFEKFGEMFPGSIKIVEGRMIKPGEAGMLLPTWTRKEFYNHTNTWFIPENTGLDTANLVEEARADWRSLNTKNNIVLMGFNQDNSATDIRLPVKSVIKYRALNTIFGHFALVDIESYRQCLGYFLASEKPEQVSAGDQELFNLEGENLDAMFSQGTLVVDDTASPMAAINWQKNDSAAGPHQAVDLENGAYNLVLVLLQDNIPPQKAIADLNALFKSENLGIRAVHWKKAMGVIGSMATLIKSALFVFVMFLFFVAIIIIINTLSMAALERSTEIGMMRAIGARKGFVSWMFLGETASLAFVFGGAGILAGMAAVKLIALAGITSENDMLQLLFGGDSFHPVLTPGDLVLTIVQLAVVTLIAVIYPLFLARNITPLDAVYKE